MPTIVPVSVVSSRLEMLVFSEAVLTLLLAILLSTLLEGMRAMAQARERARIVPRWLFQHSEYMWRVEERARMVPRWLLHSSEHGMGRGIHVE